MNKIFYFLFLINLFINLFLLIKLNKKNKNYYGEIKIDGDHSTIVFNNDDFGQLKSGDVIHFIVNRK